MTSIDLTPRVRLAPLEDAGAEERADDDGMKGPGKAAEVRNPLAGVGSTFVPTLPHGVEGPID